MIYRIASLVFKLNAYDCC